MIYLAVADKDTHGVNGNIALPLKSYREGEARSKEKEQ
jgi:hypothetical protein